MNMALLYLTLPLLSVSAVSLCSCGNGTASKTDSSALDSDSIPAEVKSVVKAVSDNDSDAFAKMVSYPLERPYPLHDIENAEEMRGYYSKMVDDSLRNAVANSKASDWESSGWRGWTLGNGEYVWIDGEIYSVNYVSQKEEAEREKLIDSEISSLPGDMRKGGWKPVTVVKAEAGNEVARIDSRTLANTDSTVYRIAIFETPLKKEQKAKLVLSGSRHLEGSMGNPVYQFSDGKGTEVIYDDYVDQESGRPAKTITVKTPEGEKEIGVVNAYWRDLVK